MQLNTTLQREKFHQNSYNWIKLCTDKRLGYAKAGLGQAFVAYSCRDKDQHNNKRLYRDFVMASLAVAQTLPELKQLYRRLAAVHHPDKGGCSQKMQILNKQYASCKSA